MKEFIVQFVMVEGEPTDICYVKSLKEYQKYTEYHWREWASYDSFDRENQDIFAVSLFLCSKQIQIGDKFKSIHHPEKEFILLEIPPIKEGEGVHPLNCYFTKYDHYIQWIPYNEAYKVLGVISSSVKWLNPGDELSEDEVAIYWYERMFTLTEARKYLRFPFVYIPIYVRCPTCKIFHRE